MTVKDWLILLFVGLPLGLCLWTLAVATLVLGWHLILRGPDDYE